MKLTLILIAVFMLIDGASAFSKARYNNQAGIFDYYLLNLSWEPEFCHSPQNANTYECKNTRDGFVVHGLWPQFTDSYPEHCSSARGLSDPNQILDIMPSTKLVQHEWSTHGTCSGLRPENYFAAMRKARASIHIPDNLTHPTHGFSLSPQQLKQAFIKANPDLHNDNIAINCGNNRLTAVEFCLRKDTLQPKTCGVVRDCRARTIQVTPID